MSSTSIPTTIIPIPDIILPPPTPRRKLPPPAYADLGEKTPDWFHINIIQPPEEDVIAPEDIESFAGPKKRPEAIVRDKNGKKKGVAQIFLDNEIGVVLDTSEVEPESGDTVEIPDLSPPWYAPNGQPIVGKICVVP
jgi:hypothetical protein